MPASEPETVRHDVIPDLAETNSDVVLLSNGRYSVFVTAAGAGYGSWQGIDVTRWQADFTRDCWGQFCYVRDLADNSLWSIGRQPIVESGVVREHAFRGDRAEFRCHSGDIETFWKVCVAGDADAEVRLLTMINHGARERSLELTSYAEVCLNNRRADQAHPAFTKLFVETTYDRTTGALFARRRPRDVNEKPTWAIHVSSSSQQTHQEPEYETDRLRFLGRGRTAANPAIFDAHTSLSGTTGPVLDPIVCLRRTIRVGPRAEAHVAFVTGAADNQSAIQAIAEQYSKFGAVEQAFCGSLDRYKRELDEFRLTPGEVSVSNLLAGYMAVGNPSQRQEVAHPQARFDPNVLWAQGISGDLPIALASVDAKRDEALIRQVMAAHDFCRRRGLVFDLVLFDEGGGTRELEQTFFSPLQTEMTGKSGGIFVVSGSGTAGNDLATITGAARLVLMGNGGSLADQLPRVSSPASLPPGEFAARMSDATAGPSPVSPENLHYWNEFGGFSDGGREYVITVGRFKSGSTTLPPAPWTNVLANPSFGCLTTEASLGYTWSGNCQMNRLTPWSNDPVSDQPGEVVYLRDDETGEIWTPTPLPIGPSAPVSVRHGQGYTRYASQSRHLKQEMTVFVPPQDTIKIISLRLHNGDARSRQISATYYVEWVLGTQREKAAMQVVCDHDVDSGAIIATNPWSGDFAGKIAFAAASPAARSTTSDRTEFLGKYGSVSRPAALQRADLAERFGPSVDPCAALKVDIALPAGETREVIFVLGQADSLDEVRRLVREYADPDHAGENLSAVSRDWDNVLDKVHVTTPDLGMNLMMNRWLLYQVLACRVWARTSNYQSGGAYGFRDQLQDVMALIHSAPGESRSQILRSAARQFEEGDVQHWWHPPSGVGVRTRITDDLYFLPYVVHHYVSTTGDFELLDEVVPFLKSAVLKDDQEEDFNTPAISEETGTIYEHCVRALKHGYRLGSHQLPLMGTGDWNDGMNKVGAEGKGESVWNGWFFLSVLGSFATISRSRGDKYRAKWCRDRAEALRVALEANAWDGAWYRRAYFDDGTPLGSAMNDECQIDALPQAWAVISGAADAGRAAQGLRVVHDRLVLKEDKLIKLFDPPFDKGVLQPGYIKGYVPGIRENGGQYTHAATWVVWATALQGDGDLALTLWNFINPICHGTTRDLVERYKVEPYVVCADIYGAPPHTGRGGWSWYTGSASWLYRVAMEAMLGLRREGRFLRFEPCVPPSWPTYEITYKHGSATYRIHFDNAKGIGRGVRSVRLDGKPVTNKRVPLVEDSHTHDVQVTIG